MSASLEIHYLTIFDSSRDTYIRRHFRPQPNIPEKLGRDYDVHYQRIKPHLSNTIDKRQQNYLNSNYTLI